MSAASSDKSNASPPPSEQVSAEGAQVSKRELSEEAEAVPLNATTDDETGADQQPTTPSKDEEAEADDDADVAQEKEQADNLRRKRDREGSLEPSLSSQQGLSTPDAIPSKKNRLQDTVIGEEQTPPSSTAAPSSPNIKAVEGEKVGQIRKRVQDLSWKQRKEGDRDGEEEEERGAIVGSAGSESKPTEESGETKKTQPSFASFSSKPSAFAASAAKDEGVDFLADKKQSSPTSSNRTQPTFSSFSKSLSPFNSASSVAGPSWLAGKPGGGSGSGTPSGGGIRPSALGSVGSTSSPSGEEGVRVTEREQPAPVAAATAAAASTASPGGKQLGFGAFASNKAFASRSSTPTSSETMANGGDNEDGNGKSFDEVLKRRDEREGESAEDYKISTQLERGHADLRTGEEDEKTLTSARGKLYTMSEDKDWKERGTGMVRCNVAKGPGGGARLVMRSEGVLRLILNVNLFKGMKINLEQDKFLRIVALEDEKLVHFAIKFANHMTAGNFYRIVKQKIPIEDGEEQA